MITVVWDKKFEVGHERIDSEHRIFLNLIREVSLMPERRVSKERIQRHLDEFKKYARFHFTSEENIMLDIAYPDYESHSKEHEVLLAQLDERVFEYEKGRLILDDVVSFLFEWFALHTTQIDTRLSGYIAEHQAEAS
jgi:hemerythrin